MRNYFAYGSNMSLARLQERVGEVALRGTAQLAGYVHSFDHRGRDGTAKGNITAASSESMLGVLYGLSDEQVQLLAPYEGGYEMISLELQLVATSSRIDGYSYVSRLSTFGLSPLPAYLEHYYNGMLEHGFPQAYIELIRRQAGL